MSNTPSNPTRDRLIEAAITQLAANPKATLAQIAAAAGVKRVTLHRLLGSRKSLLQIIAVQALRDMDQACQRAAANEITATGALKAIVAALVPLADRVHFLWDEAQAWSGLQAETDRHNAELAVVIDAAKAEGGISKAIPSSWILASIDATLFTALTAVRNGEVSRAQAADLATATLFGGISPALDPENDTAQRS